MLSRMTDAMGGSGMGAGVNQRKQIQMTPEEVDAFLHERHSRVTFELVQLDSQVQLTVTHDEFDEGSKVFESISGGWPRVLSSLKSLLETGRGLPRSWSDADKKWQTCSAEARA